MNPGFLLLLEAALRAAVGAIAVWCGLRLLRVRNVPVQKAAWGMVLAAAVTMPLAMRWHWLAATVSVPLPNLHWNQAAVAAPEAHAAVPEIPQVPAVPRSPSSLPRARHARPRATDVAAPVQARQAELAPMASPEAPSLSSAELPPISSPATAPSPIPTRAFWATVGEVLYFGVCAVLLLRLLWGLGAALWLWLQAEPIRKFDGLDAAWTTEVRSSRRVGAPINIGSGVLLPADYAHWDAKKLRIVLAHEHSHIRQGDFYLQALAGIYAAIFWFSPLGWWLKRKLSELGEAISDRAGLDEAASGSSYAQLLLEFAALPHPTLIGVAMARKSNLSHRMEQFLNESHFRQAFAGSRRRAFVVVLLTSAALFASTAMIRVQAAGSGQASPPSASSAPSSAPAPAAPAWPAAPAAAAAPAPPTSSPARGTTAPPESPSDAVMAPAPPDAEMATPADIEARVAQLQAELQRKMSEIQAEAPEIQRQIAETQAKLAKAQAGAPELQARMAQMQAELQAKQAYFQTVASELQKQIAELQSKLAKTRADAPELQARMAQMQAELQAKLANVQVDAPEIRAHIAELHAKLMAAEAAAGQDQTFDRTLTVIGKADLSVATGSGNIHLTRGTAGQVKIHGIVHANDGASADDVNQIIANPPIQQDGNTIRVGGQNNEHMHNISLSYEIEAPADTTLTAATGSGNIVDEGVGGETKLTAGSGNINATGLQGVFAVMTGSGNISLEETGSGDGKAQTGSGNLEIKDVHGGLNAMAGSGTIKASGTPSAPWKLMTGSGTIELWAGNAPITLDASVGSGTIHTDHEMVMEGTVNPHHIVGKINGGGTEVRVQTGSGSITVH